jgi:glycosyltransferase involved in cell wall biosynthesis
MRVIHKGSDDAFVQGGFAQGAVARRVRTRMAQWPLIPLRGKRKTTISPAWPATGLGPELNQSPADILNLHWLGSDTLSIKEIGNLSKPVVWLLHDMYAFCGAEHYAEDQPDSRFRTGYLRANAPEDERLYDLSRRVWERKRKHWRERIHIVCPSRWLARCAVESALFAWWPISVIPHPLDLNVWRPLTRALAREALGLDRNAKLVLFGAPSGLKDSRKGGDLALAALRHLAAQGKGPDGLIVFGQSAPASSAELPLPTRFLGRLHDDLSLVLAYSAADVFLMPSRMEAFGQTASEALACGTPVVAFDAGGLPDIVTHQETGWLAKPFEPESMAEGISWLLADAERLERCSRHARESAELRFDQTVVGERYAALYREILAAPTSGELL